MVVLFHVIILPKKERRYERVLNRRWIGNYFKAEYAEIHRKGKKKGKKTPKPMENTLVYVESNFSL